MGGRVSAHFHKGHSYAPQPLGHGHLSLSFGWHDGYMEFNENKAPVLSMDTSLVLGSQAVITWLF